MQTLWLVCDRSGSIIEGGKRLIVRSLVREVEQYFRFGHATKHELKLVLWNDEALPIEWNPDDEVPSAIFDCKGSANSEAITALIGNEPNGKILMLTDGFWSDKSRNDLKRWKSELPTDALRIILIGADANNRLRGEDVFCAENLFSAFDGWLGVGA